MTEPASAAEESIKTSKAFELITEEVESLIEVIRRIEGYDAGKVPAARNDPLDQKERR